MKKIFFILLCAASAVLVSCEKSTTTSEEPTPTPQPQPTVDTTTYVVEVRTYAGDDFLQYVTAEYLIKNSNSEDYETLLNVKEVPADETKDNSIMIFMADSKLIKEQLHVFSATLRLPVGNYDFRVKYTRNATPVATDSIYDVSGFTALSATALVNVTHVEMLSGEVKLDPYINLLQSKNKPHYNFEVCKKY